MCKRPVAWLSLDKEDSDPRRFLGYLVAALQTLALSDAEGILTDIGEGTLRMLQSSQPPPTDLILTALLLLTYYDAAPVFLVLPIAELLFL